MQTVYNGTATEAVRTNVLKLLDLLLSRTSEPVVVEFDTPETFRVTVRSHLQGCQDNQELLSLEELVRRVGGTLQSSRSDVLLLEVHDLRECSEISTRMYNRLWRHGFVFLGEAAAVPIQSLEGFRDWGKQTTGEFERLLASRGLNTGEALTSVEREMLKRARPAVVARLYRAAYDQEYLRPFERYRHYVYGSEEDPPSNTAVEHG